MHLEKNILLPHIEGLCVILSWRTEMKALIDCFWKFCIMRVLIFCHDSIHKMYPISFIFCLINICTTMNILMTYNLLNTMVKSEKKNYSVLSPLFFFMLNNCYQHYLSSYMISLLIQSMTNSLHIQLYKTGHITSYAC